MTTSVDESNETPLSPELAEGVLTLPDGRSLAWTSLGSGHPVLWCHGSNGGRLDRRYLELAGVDGCDTRFIAFDRPGYGGSTRSLGASLVDGARDIEQLADELGLDRFSVLGYSMGGPYAIVAAAVLGDRVIAAGSIAGVPPLDSAEAWATVPGPAPLFRAALEDGVEAVAGMLRPLYPATAEILQQWLAQFDGTVDGTFLDGRPDLREAVVAGCVEAMRQGPGGWADDHRAVATDWGIDWDAIRHLVVYQGTQDPLVRVGAGELIAKRAKNGALELVKGRGHFGWIEALPTVLGELTQVGRA